MKSRVMTTVAGFFNLSVTSISPERAWSLALKDASRQRRLLLVVAFRGVEQRKPSKP